MPRVGRDDVCRVSVFHTRDPVSCVGPQWQPVEPDTCGDSRRWYLSVESRTGGATGRQRLKLWPDDHKQGIGFTDR